MILVVGATGSLGGRIALKLLDQGKPVRVLARHNSLSEELAKTGMATSVETLRQAGVYVVYGDMDGAGFAGSSLPGCRHRDHNRQLSIAGRSRQY